MSLGGYESSGILEVEWSVFPGFLVVDSMAWTCFEVFLGQWKKIGLFEMIVCSCYADHGQEKDFVIVVNETLPLWEKLMSMVKCQTSQLSLNQLCLG